MKSRPCILCIGGHDPTGGAGLQADIETVNGLGARATTLVTCLTAQDSSDVHTLFATPEDDFRRQRDTLLADIQPDAVKIGVLATPGIANAVAECLDGFEGPVVVDPVLAAGGGSPLASADLARLIADVLLPLSTLVTPNRAELRRLADTEDEQAAIEQLLQTGVGGLLVTGADEAIGDQVVNQLHRRKKTVASWQWPRLPHGYHGSGCTLASACAVRLALGDDLATAVSAAQSFTWNALVDAESVGSGQHLPRRTQ